MSLHLRDYQREATQEIIDSFEEHDRCLLKMWCGTGKTRVFFFHLLEQRLPLSVVVFPSLALVDQFRKDYLDNAQWKDRVCEFEVLVVCMYGTTDADVIEKFIDDSDDRPKIIVVTYQSFHLVHDLKADLMIFDEAHHVVEDRVRDLVFSESEEKVVVKKMLFVTATPEKKNGIDMLDGICCGPVAYDYTYCQAVNEGVCNAFQVVPFAVAPRFEGENRVRNILPQLEKDANAVGHGRILTFHGLAEAESNSRSDVLRFVQTAQDHFKENSSVTVRGITGSTAKEDRDRLLWEFESCPDNKMSLLASCNTMGEGVDTKTANKVVFFDPKTSHKSVAQAIGRVTRLQPGGVSEVHVIMDMDLEALQETQDSTTLTVEEKDATIREALGKSMCVTLNVFSWLKEEDPEYASLCLHYPNRFSSNEVHRNLERQGCVVEEEALTIEKMFGTATLEEAAEKQGGAIEVHNTSMETPIVRIGEGDVVARIAEGEEEGTYHEVMMEDDGGEQQVEPPRRKPFFRVPKGSDGFSVMWKVVADGMGRSLLEFDAGGITPSDKVDATLIYVKKNDKSPPFREKVTFKKNGVVHEICIGQFWAMVKHGYSKDLRDRLLENDILKADYDKCQEKKEQKKSSTSPPPRISLPQDQHQQPPFLSSDELVTPRGPLPPCTIETDSATMTMKQWHQKAFTMRSERLASIFSQDPQRWHAYHQTREQATHDYDPLDRVVQEMKALKHRKAKTVADLGCGTGKLARELGSNKKFDIKSLDFVALPDLPESYACDISRCDILEDNSVNIAVLCLALWGTNMEDTLRSAYRILETNGVLYLVEPTRRWTVDAREPVQSLLDLVTSIGFQVVTSEFQADDRFLKFAFFKLIKNA